MRHRDRVLLGPVQDAARDSWPQVQGDASHSGYVPQSIAPPYRELWRRDTPPVSTRVQPIIAEGLIFLPSNDGALYALSASNGRTAWSYPTGGALVNSAAYEDGRVFFGSTDRFIYAVNTDGSLAWRFETGSTIKAAPTVAEGKAFVGSSDGHMYALDQETGVLMWRFDVGAPIYDTAAYDNGKVFFGGMDCTGYALDADTGDLIWSLAMPGQGFRDRWTVAGNGHVFFTPMIYDSHWDPLGAGTSMFREDADPPIYNQPWSVQRQAIIDYLAAHPYHQPLFVVDQETGEEAFTPPVLYASGGSQSPHSQPILLPNGNANVIYRRSFGKPAEWGQTTADALFTGELDLTTGDVIPLDRCQSGAGGWADCGDYKGPYISDESSALVRSGDILYVDAARGTLGLDTATETMLPTVACYNVTSGGPFLEDNCRVTYEDYNPPPGGWRVDYDNLESELSSEGNDLKRPTPIVDNVFYVFHYNTLVAVEGTERGVASVGARNKRQEIENRLDSGAGSHRAEMAPVAPQILDVRQELESRVREVIASGHMAPTLYFNGLGGGGTNLGSPAIFYATPAETIHTLSSAYPYLQASLKSLVKTYLDEELRTYPPHLYGHYPPESGTVSDFMGATREYFIPNPDQRFNFWPGPPVHISALYSLWLYSHTTADWRYVTDNYGALKSIYADFKNGSDITTYSELSGVLGFSRIAEHLGQTADHEDASAFAQAGFDSGADFDEFLATARINYPDGNQSLTTPIFMFHRNPIAVHFNPDIGAFLYENSFSAVAAYVEEVSRQVPLWWLTDVALDHGENAYATPEISWTLFMLHGYVLDTPVEQLSQYLDAPNRKGDLLYIQKLVAVVEALGPPDLTPSTKSSSTAVARSGDRITYTVAIRNGGSPITDTVYMTDAVPAQVSYIPGTLTATLGIPDDSAVPTLHWSGVLAEAPSALVSYAVNVSLPNGSNRVEHIRNVATIRADSIGVITRGATIILSLRDVYLPMVLKE